MSWRLLYTKQARKDARKLAAAGLKPKAEELLTVLAADPFQSPPPLAKLAGDLSGVCSRRITIHHRLAYQVLVDEHVVKGAEDVDPLRVNRRIDMARRHADAVIRKRLVRRFSARRYALQGVSI